jgi:pimeloyl-ACP methyl ester carboxylesterase
MPAIDVAPGIHLHYEEDDYTDAWSKAPDCVLMLHGIGETGIAFRAWAPHFARKYRVIRPDLRGFGRSSALGSGELKGVTLWADDVESVVRQLGCARVHVIGAKLGALIAMELAQRQAPWMASMTLAGLLLSPKKAIGPWVGEWMRHIDEQGMESWARLTMPGRLGTAVSAEANEWWVRQMAAAPPASVKACLRMVAHVDEPEALEKVSVPTLVIVSSGRGAAGEFEQRQSVEAVDRFRRRIPDSKLMQVEATSYHVAGTHPDECAIGARRFIDERAERHP